MSKYRGAWDSGVFTSKGTYVDTAYYDPAICVNSNIILGGDREPENEDFIEDFEITAILACAEENTKPDNFKGEWLWLNMEDDPDPKIKHIHLDIIKKGADFIDKQVKLDKTIYVHCQMGINRSPTVIIYYLIHYLNYTYHQAFAYLRSIRDCIEPANIYKEILQESVTKK